MNKLLLSICIPTYNREEKVIALLEKLKKETFDYRDIVEIVVAENPSTTPNNDILKNYMDRNKIFKFYCHSENIGFSRNYYFLLNSAQSKFVWILGDDEYIVDGGIKSILEMLQNNKNYNHFLLKREGYIKDYENRVPIQTDYSDIYGLNTNIKDILLKYNKESCDSFLLSDLMFISLNIFKLSTVKKHYVSRYKEVISSGSPDMFYSDGLFLSLCMLSDGLYIHDTTSILSNKTPGPMAWDSIKHWVTVFLIPQLIIDSNNTSFDTNFKRKLLKTYYSRSLYFFRLFLYIPKENRKVIINFLKIEDIIYLFLNRLLYAPKIILSFFYRFILTKIKYQ